MPSDHILVRLGPAIRGRGVDLRLGQAEFRCVEPVGPQNELLDGGGADLVQTPESEQGQRVLVQAHHHRPAGLDRSLQSLSAVEIVARAVLIDDEDVYPDIHLGIDCVLEVAF